VVGTAKALRMYRITVLSVAAGGGDDSGFAAGVSCRRNSACVYEREYDDSEDEYGHEVEMDMPELGHGGEGTELVPRLIEVLAGKQVIGAGRS